MKKTLTVAVPSYNVERYLADSAASYCAAGIDDRLEVLIVDDGSTDNTPAIASACAEMFPDVFRVVTKANGGHGSAINSGIHEARGKYFRVIDGDDRICSANVSALLDELDEASEDLVIDVKREIMMGTLESRLLSLPDDLPRRCTVDFEQVCNRSDIEEFFMIHSTNVRTDFLRKHEVSLLEHTFYVDYEFIVKVASRAQSARFLDLEACNYYIGNSEQSVAPLNYVKRWDDHTRVTRELLAFTRNESYDGERRRFVESRVDLLVNTHYNIALIYDPDRKRGLARAYEFRAYLKDNYPREYRAGEKRYWQARILHALGFDAAKLDRLMRR